MKSSRRAAACAAAVAVAFSFAAIAGDEVGPVLDDPLAPKH